MPLKPIPLSELQKIGEGLSRPEGVVVGRDGRVWASDQSAAVALVRPDGIKKMGKAGGAPNGLAMDLQGRILIANFGVTAGKPGPLQRLDPATGKLETLADTLEGQILTASNFPAVAADGTIYCTHSTWIKPMSAVTAQTSPDGIVYRVSPAGKLDTVAHGLLFANGCCLDADEKNLYVVQTLGANVVRMPRRPDGTLGEAKPYGPQLGQLRQEPLTVEALAKLDPREKSRVGFGDGCQFDVEGNLWVTLPVANRIVAITPNHAIFVIVNDPEGAVVNMPTNIAFGGSDMRDLYIAMIGAPHIVKTRSPVPGLRLTHQR